MTFVEPSHSVDTLLFRIGRIVGATPSSDLLTSERLRDALQGAINIVCAARDWSWTCGYGSFDTVANVRAYNLRTIGSLTLPNGDFNIYDATNHVYQIEAMKKPATVLEDATVMTESPTLAGVVSTANRWYYDDSLYTLFIRASDDSDIVASEKVYTTTGELMPDFLTIRNMRDHETGNLIGFLSEGDFERKFGYNKHTPGNPSYYYKIGSYGVGLYPRPSTARRIDISYTRQHRDITIGGTLLVPSYLHECLVYLAKQLYKFDLSVQSPGAIADPMVQAYIQQATAIDDPIGTDLASPEVLPDSRILKPINITASGFTNE